MTCGAVSERGDRPAPVARGQKTTCVRCRSPSRRGGAGRLPDALTARMGWAHVGWLYPVAGAVVLTVGAVAWRRGTRGVPGATRARVARRAGPGGGAAQGP